MNKILVKIFFPHIDMEYNVWIPNNKRIYDIIILLYTGLNELNNNTYQPENIPILYNKATGNYYDINMLVKNTDITNGTELVLI